MLRSLGDLAGARSLFERALEIDETCYGPNHPAVAKDLNNLAILNRAGGDLEQARRQYERTLQILEARLGPHHPSTELVRGNLAHLDRARA